MTTLERNLNHWFHLRRFDGWNLVFLMAMPFISIVLFFFVHNPIIYMVASACIAIPFMVNDSRHLHAMNAKVPGLLCWVWLPIYMLSRELNNKGNIRLFWLFMALYLFYFFVALDISFERQAQMLKTLGAIHG